jgi:Protein of unknown function (DUF3551)
MKSLLKLIAVAAAVRALTLVAIPTAALAGEYCLTNTSGMRGCGFATLQQCLDTLSGSAGTCTRDPFYLDPHSALAYEPKRSHSHSKKRAERQSLCPVRLTPVA